MSWQVNLAITRKENVRETLDTLTPAFEAQLPAHPIASHEALRAQFGIAMAAARTLSDMIPGPKIAGRISGHANAPGTAGDTMDRITIDLYQVRFVGE